MKPIGNWSETVVFLATAFHAVLQKIGIFACGAGWMKAPSRHVHLNGAKVLLSRLTKYITPSTEYQGRELLVGLIRKDLQSLRMGKRCKDHRFPTRMPPAIATVEDS